MLPFVSVILVACGMPAVVEEEPIEVVEPEAEALEMPDTIPGSGEDIASGGLEAPQDPPDPNAAAAVPPDEWNPVSVPLGPREGGGVKWDGVKKRGGDVPKTLESEGLTEAEIEASTGFSGAK